MSQILFRGLVWEEDKGKRLTMLVGDEGSRADTRGTKHWHRLVSCTGTVLVGKLDKRQKAVLQPQ